MNNIKYPISSVWKSDIINKTWSIVEYDVNCVHLHSGIEHDFTLIVKRPIFDKYFILYRSTILTGGFIHYSVHDQMHHPTRKIYGKIVRINDQNFSSRPLLIKWDDLRELQPYSVNWADENLQVLKGNIYISYNEFMKEYKRKQVEECKFKLPGYFTNLKNKEELKMKKIIEKKYFFNGKDVSEMSENDIIHSIAKMGDEISHLKDIDTDSKVVKKKIKMLEKTLVKFVKLTDTNL